MADQANTDGGVAPPNTTGGAPAGGDATRVAYGTGVNQPNEITITPEISEWAKAKGYKDFDALAKTNPEVYKMATSYRETEKFVGGDKLPLPKDMNDQAALKTVFSKLGMPDKADGYQIKIPEGQDPGFGNKFKEAAHANNLTQTQAAGMTDWWNGTVEQVIKADENQRAEKAAADLIGLQKDWGGKFEANKEVSVRAQNMLSSELGIPRDKLTDGLEEVFGLRDASRILHFLGTKAQVTNDSFEGGDHNSERGGGNVMSVQDAKGEKTRLMNDPVFAKSYRAGDTSARQKLSNLNAVIAAETPSQEPRVSSGSPSRR